MAGEAGEARMGKRAQGVGRCLRASCRSHADGVPSVWIPITAGGRNGLSRPERRSGERPGAFPQARCRAPRPRLVPEVWETASGTRLSTVIQLPPTCGHRIIPHPLSISCGSCSSAVSQPFTYVGPRLPSWPDADPRAGQHRRYFGAEFFAGILHAPHTLPKSLTPFLSVARSSRSGWPVACPSSCNTVW